MSFSQFLDPHLTTYHPSIVVDVIVVFAVQSASTVDSTTPFMVFSVTYYVITFYYRSHFFFTNKSQIGCLDTIEH